MMPHRRQVSRRPRTGTRWRGDCGRREVSFCRHPPALPEKNPSAAPARRAETGSTAAGWPRQQGPEAARVGAQGLATTLDSPQRVGPLHLRPESLQDLSQAWTLEFNNMVTLDFRSSPFPGHCSFCYCFLIAVGYFSANNQPEL